ncbi:Serine/threonine-protein phosphatase 2A activator [Cichlidogyrus casuarinus]|uniref:Serine/threonine-protein phosphatase 2A activator n=1 Tax=Cichlidogyrus casuarinus TaxID=1844966 RepID=A0ABD2PZP1_9PLAT
MVLSKQINSINDVAKWEKSVAYMKIMDLIEAVNKAVAFKPIPDSPKLSKNVEKVDVFLKNLNSDIQSVPLDVQPQRFGNKAFRQWFDSLEKSLKDKLQCSLFDEFALKDDDLSDLVDYFMESVGNRIRIDYGTGHELAFIAFLSNLFTLNYVSSEPAPDRSSLSDLCAIGLVIMPAYLNLVRHLQTYFHMEPAGSHGVWSLDDFQFVPFIWGSSQLLENVSLPPDLIPDHGVAAAEKDRYLFFGCIDYIFKVKTGPFFEHSSTLFGLTQVREGWSKINKGMIKMYKAEVLAKFPVVQHFKFGKHLTMELCTKLEKPLNVSRRPPPSFKPPTSIIGENN